MSIAFSLLYYKTIFYTHIIIGFIFKNLFAKLMNTKYLNIVLFSY